jgi:hypothetical protein
MADTLRTTKDVLWVLGCTDRITCAGPPRQDGPKIASIGRASPTFGIDPLNGGEVSLSPLVLIFTAAIIVVLLAIVLARGRAKKRLTEKNRELDAARRQSERKAKESEATLKQSKEKIKELEEDIARLTAPRPKEPLCEDGAKVRLAIPPDGREVFFPPLDPHRVYQITMEGICGFSEYKGWSSRDVRADALHHTDEVGNFVIPHDWLRLGYVPVKWFYDASPAETVAEADREAHRYSFRIDGDAQKISVRFHVADKRLRSQPKGALWLMVEVLPDGTPSPRAARQREEPDRAAAALKTRLEKEKTALVNELARLQRRVHLESHFLDPVFQQDFAKRGREKILRTLKRQWEVQYDQIMHDPCLKKLAEERAPEVIQLAEARLNIVQLAERFAVAPQFPKKIEELKQGIENERALALSKRADRFDEEIALMKLKGQKLAEVTEAADALPVDDDEKQRLRQQVLESILEEGEEHEHGENGDTL